MREKLSLLLPSQRLRGYALQGVELNTTIKPSKPRDKMIAGGLFVEQLNDDTFHDLKAKLDEAFERARKDVSKEYGECIAYSSNLNDEDVAIIDHAILNGAADQNHGMRPQKVTPEDQSQRAEQTVLWRGIDAVKRKFSIAKFVGPIALENGQAPDGIVYSFTSQKAD